MSFNLDPSDPVVSPARLHDLSLVDFESPEVRAVLDGFARRAAELLDLPIGMVSIVLDSAQLFAGLYGLDGWLAEVRGTPVEWSFCATAVRTGAPYVVTDAVSDPLQFDNPLVVEDGIRSYVGAPVFGPTGTVLGACCAIGSEPREFTPAEIARLETLAAEVTAELALRVLGAEHAA